MTTPEPTETTDPLAALKEMEAAEKKRLQQLYGSRRAATEKYADGARMREEANELEQRGRERQAEAVAALLASGLSTSDVQSVLGLDQKQVRELVRLAESAKRKPEAAKRAPRPEPAKDLPPPPPGDRSVVRTIKSEPAGSLAARLAAEAAM